MQESNSAWPQVVALFEAAICLPEAEREPWLREQCHGDEETYNEVSSLLAAAVQEKLASRSLPAQGAEGRRYGPWEVIKLLGTGGMGSVLLVKRADGQYEQQAALKLVAAHLVGGYFLERLKAERQILADLNHPNITKLVDGGLTEDGIPYLVMEFVDGVAIDEYCDANRLDLAARLRLFITVCDAVQCAHHGLVAHLDLKPSNILVTKDGTVKLLDFGTAKLFEHAADQTTKRALTPDYASPEQLRGETVTSACDIYSLGVILYELLTGTSPFHHQGAMATLAGRLATGTDPPPISAEVSQEAAERRSMSLTQLRKQLRGDLSLIVPKAMASEARRRYDSPSGLAEDIQRYLDGRSVGAQRQTVLYQLGKFIRRNRGAAALTMILILGLITVGVYALLQQRHALEEARRTRTINKFLTSIFRLGDPTALGRYGITVKELLELAEKVVEPTLGHDAAIRSDIHGILADAFWSQGQLSKALQLQQESMSEAVQTNDPVRRSVAIARLAIHKFGNGQFPAALKDVDLAMDLFHQYGRSFAIEQQFVVLSIAGTLGFYAQPESPKSLPLLEKAVRLARANPEAIDSYYLSNSLNTLGESRTAQKRYAEAEKLIEEAIALDRMNPLLASLLPEHLAGLSRLSRRQGRAMDSERYQRESYQASRSQYGPDHLGTANNQSRWGFTLLEIGAVDEGARNAAEALLITRKYYPAGSFNLWTTLATACYALALTGKYEQSEALGREAIQSLGPNPSPQDARLQETRGYLALALVGQNKYAEARPMLEQTLQYYSTGTRAAFAARLEAALKKAKQ